MMLLGNSSVFQKHMFYV